MNIGCVFVFVLFTSPWLSNGQDCPDPVCRDEWNVADFPNPRKESGLCGRDCEETFVCDPCQVFSGHEVAEIDEMIKHVPAHTTICRGTEEYVISVAIVNKMEITAGTKKTNAMYFAETLRDRWDYGLYCHNDVVIFFSLDDRQIFTSPGSDANRILTADCIQGIYEEARDKYLKSDQYSEGIKHMIGEYKRVFKDGKCVDLTNMTLTIVFGTIGSLAFIATCGYCVICRSCRDKIDCGTEAGPRQSSFGSRSSISSSSRGGGCSDGGYGGGGGDDGGGGGDDGGGGGGGDF